MGALLTVASGPGLLRFVQRSQFRGGRQHFLGQQNVDPRGEEPVRASLFEFYGPLAVIYDSVSFTRQTGQDIRDSPFGWESRSFNVRVLRFLAYLLCAPSPSRAVSRLGHPSSL